MIHWTAIPGITMSILLWKSIFSRMNDSDNGAYPGETFVSAMIVTIIIIVPIFMAGYYWPK